MLPFLLHSLKAIMSKLLQLPSFCLFFAKTVSTPLNSQLDVYWTGPPKHNRRTLSLVAPSCMSEDRGGSEM